MPAYVQIEPVGQCNLRCRMCAAQLRSDGPGGGRPAFMEFTAFTRIIDQLPSLREVHLQGLGEPTMHPSLWSMVAYAAGRGIRVTTNSNLTILSRRQGESCVASGLDSLSVSIDGATAETYQHIRTGSRLDRVLRNLKSLLEIRSQMGKEQPHLRLVVVAMRRNLHELPALVRLAREWRMEAVFVQHLCHDFTEASLPDQYGPMKEFVATETLLGEDRDRVDKYFASARSIAYELGIDLRLPRVEPLSHPPGTAGYDRCDWPWKGMYISYQGYAMPCCMVGTPDRINFGNVFDRDLASIWNGSKYRKFRHRLSSESPPEICGACSVYRHTF